MAIEEVNKTHLPLWVQAKGITLEELTPESAELIGNEVGKILEAENPLTHECFRGFLRVKVEIEASMPLKDGFWMPREDGDQSWVELKYERLSDFCFGCARLGHTVNACMFGERDEFGTIIRKFDSRLRARIIRPEPLPAMEIDGLTPTRRTATMRRSQFARNGARSATTMVHANLGPAIHSVQRDQTGHLAPQQPSVQRDQTGHLTPQQPSMGSRQTNSETHQTVNCAQDKLVSVESAQRLLRGKDHISTSDIPSRAPNRPTVSTLSVIKDWLTTSPSSPNQNSQVFKGPSSWQLHQDPSNLILPRAVGPNPHEPCLDPQLNDTPIGSPTSQTHHNVIGERDMPQHEHCSSICCLGKRPLTCHEKARLCGELDHSSAIPMVNTLPALTSYPQPTTTSQITKPLTSPHTSLKRNLTSETSQANLKSKLRKVSLPSNSGGVVIRGAPSRSRGGRGKGRRGPNMGGVCTLDGRRNFGSSVEREVYSEIVTVNEGSQDISASSSGDVQMGDVMSPGGGGWPTTAARSQ